MVKIVQLCARGRSLVGLPIRAIGGIKRAQGPQKANAENTSKPLKC